MLRALDADPALAGERYEAIRERLLVYFAARRCAEPEDLADEALDRAARRIAENVSIETSVENFVLGVARNLAKERWKKPLALVAMPERLPAPPVTEPDPRADCLDECLGQLPSRTREWVERFYTGTGGAKIEERKRLAHELGLDVNALRVRLFRIREKLERCVRECMARNENVKGTI
ncbi:MAG: hypothetical protein FJW30_22045 [Acidobacteria bacterium]|nr:hypothetical protein [Acidobacteriota bacterium]